MSKISLAFPVTLSNANKYLPLMEKNKNNLIKAYGLVSTDDSDLYNKFIDKIKLYKLPLQISVKIIGVFTKILRVPKYYMYLSKVKIFDLLVHRKIANDKSEIVFTSPLLKKTIKSCKKKNKIVVVEAGNSEPLREHKLITAEYSKYNIKRKYVYGGNTFWKTCRYSIKNADRVITLSDVSLKTYMNSIYEMSKFTTIKLTGTDFPILHTNKYDNKKKAFISTGFHNFIKGTHNLLLSWKKAEIKNVPLILVGRINEDVSEFISKYGPFDNVIFTGHIKDLQKFYSEYDAVGVLMSLSEGAVRVTPEMMSFGFPMIVSPDATCDIVKDGYNGFVIDALDNEKLTAVMKEISRDWSVIDNMRENVFSSVENRTTRDYSYEISDYLNKLSTKKGV